MTTSDWPQPIIGARIGAITARTIVAGERRELLPSEGTPAMGLSRTQAAAGGD